MAGIEFLDEVLGQGYRELVLDDWRSREAESVELPEDFELLRRVRSGFGVEILVRVGGCIAKLHPIESEVRVWIAGPTEKEVSRLLERIEALYPRGILDDPDPRLPVDFWYQTPRVGPTHRTREIRMARWGDVAGNYPEETRAALARLMDGRPKSSAGRIILWHGPPGTGKTWAIRALAWEWREWADLHYVTDPEVFFGDEPSYLFEVALDGRDHDERWRLLVLEDTGEMMAVDAKAQVGQALSRLLNVADGLLGQGLKIMLLVTSNEPLSKLHPALVRPGRCAADVAFRPLSPAEADAWLGQHESARAGRAMTIAELHAHLDGNPRKDRLLEPVGFAPAVREGR